MIRFATSSDYSQIESLWQIAFGDSVSYIRAFWDDLGQPNRCLVYESDHQILSMLFLLPIGIEVGVEVRTARYIYACATQPAHQCKGLMGMLIAEAFEISRRQADVALVLIPADDKLCSYYRKSGFSPFFKKPLFKTPSSDSLQKAQPLTPQLIPQLIGLRERLLHQPGAVHWGARELQFAFSFSDEEQVRVVVESDSYQIIGGDNRILEALPLTDFSVRSSEDYAMIRFCEPVDPQLTSAPYFNFGLD